jgi:hypothetical protein
MVRSTRGRARAANQAVAVVKSPAAADRAAPRTAAAAVRAGEPADRQAAEEAERSGSGAASSGDGGAAGSIDPSCKKNGALPERRCRNGDDCALGSICAPAPLGPSCGANMMAMRLCYADTDCADGSVCLQQPVPACTIGIPTACGPACTASSCKEDERCATTGHCEPRPCDDGFDCGVSRVCDPGAASVDQHGCRAASCSSDDFECAEDRVCNEARTDADVNGCAPKLCSDGAWTCDDGYVCGDPTILDAHGCRCGSDAVCGVDGVCGSAGYCIPRPCTTDDDCDCGVCVNGTLGHCAPDFYYCSTQAP